LLTPRVGNALPEATFTLEENYINYPVTLFSGTGNFYGIPGDVDYPGGSFGIQPAPFVSATGSEPLGWGPDPSASWSLSVSNSLTVYVKIDGASTSTPVPVDVDGLADATASGSGRAQVSLSFYPYPTVDEILYQCSAASTHDNCGDYDKTAYLFGDTVYGFTISASGTTGPTTSSGMDVPLDGTFQVTIDPTFEIDPTFLADNPGLNLQLLESPGVGNSETPEPGTLALLGSGMLGVAGALRRKMRS
jgi:hypothetical protein